MEGGGKAAQKTPYAKRSASGSMKLAKPHGGATNIGK